MKTLIAALMTAARNRASFHQTRAELSHLSAAMRRDLAIYDIDRTARRAVWG